MAFDIEIERPVGLGVTWRLDISFDNWVTIAHRFVDREGLWAHSCLEELSFSAPWDYSLWTAGGVTLLAGQLASDGSTRATKVTDTAANVEHKLSFACNLTNERGMRPSTLYRYFVVAKADTLSWIALRDVGGAHAANFNLTTGAVGAFTSGTNPEMLALGGGFYLCSAEFTVPSGASQAVIINLGNADTGTGASYAYLGTAQSLYLHEAGAVELAAQSTRLVNLGGLSRALGEDFIVSHSLLSVTLSNEDGGLDSLVNDWTMSLKIRARFYVGLYTPGIMRAHWRQLGEYTYDDCPDRSSSVLDIALQDRLAVLEPFRAPSLKDWYEQDVYCPYHWYAREELEAITATEAWSAPLPIAFGDQALQLTFFPQTYGISANNSGVGSPNVARFAGQTPWVLCATLNDAAVSGDEDEVGVIWLEKSSYDMDDFYAAGPTNLAELAKDSSIKPLAQMTDLDKDNKQYFVWSVRKSGPVTVDGRGWYLLWILVDILGLPPQLANRTAPAHGLRFVRNADGSVSPLTSAGTRMNGNLTEWGTRASASLLYVSLRRLGRAWSAGSRVLSHMASATRAQHHPVDIIDDFARHYTQVGQNIDDARMAQTKATTPGRQGALCINGMGERSASVLDAVMSDFAESMDLDVFMTWEGKLTALGSNETFDAATADLPHFYEHELSGLTQRMPSRQMRGAYANRVTLDFEVDLLLDDARAGGESQPPSRGPFDDAAAPIAVTERVFSRELNARWTPRALLRQNPWGYRTLNRAPRQRIRFTTGLRALNLELGDYFSLDWARGGTVVYEGTVFQVLGLALNPDSASVDVEALWAGELRLNRPYLLDTEGLQAREKLSARSLTLTHNSSVVDFASGSLVAEGIDAGDVLVLRDDVAGLWRRYAAYRIVSVGSVTQLTVVADDADYTWNLTSGTVVVTDGAWSIVRGATTAHTAITDAVNYPYGSSPYGKVANGAAAGTYSDAGFGHVLKE